MDFPDNVTRLCGMKRFSFACHPDVACFTECCRELDLALTPYDVLCLCKELQLSSKDFIDRYIVVEQDEKGAFPGLYLGMVDDGKASCPFIGENGCKVYKSRPGACRAYPVGRGATLDENGAKKELYVLVKEEHCQGFAEEQSYNAAEWLENQGLPEYNKINDEVLELLHHEKVQKGIILTEKQLDYFLLALYKLDEYRDYISSPDFAEKYNLSNEEIQSVISEDLELLRFGIRWLKQVLLDEKDE